jgi:eukaryotic-like serine/threonine-protein kinase
MASDDARLIDIFTFTADLRRSGLIEELRLKLLLYEFSTTAELPLGKTVTSLATFLVGKKALTTWQVAKLREGKHKGYFQNEYLILDYLSSTSDSSRYLARDLAKKRLVYLTVSARGSNSNPIEGTKFDIEEI